MCSDVIKPQTKLRCQRKVCPKGKMISDVKGIRVYAQNPCLVSFYVI